MIVPHVKIGLYVKEANNIDLLFNLFTIPYGHQSTKLAVASDELNSSHILSWLLYAKAI